MALQRCIMLGETLSMPFEMWKRILKKDIMELVNYLAKQQNARDYPDVDKTLRLAIKIMSRTFLQSLDDMKTAPDFSEIWLKMLHLLQQSCSSRDDELSEAVPEEAKNLLLVMNKEGILVKSWVDENGANLWDATWRKARDISFALKPDVLE